MITDINRYFVGNPNIVGIVTTDDLATITATDYFLDQAPNVELIQNGNFEFTPTDMVLIFYDGGIGFFTYDAITFTFVETASAGNVRLPVLAGDFANFIGTTGLIGDAGYAPSNPDVPTVCMADGPFTVNHFANFIDSAGTIQDSGQQATSLVSAFLASVNGAGGIIPGHIAVFADANGTIADGGASGGPAVLITPTGDQTITLGGLNVAAGNIVSTLGNIIAGSSGTTGSLISFPPTPSTGYIQVLGSSNSGVFIGTLTNASLGQSTAWIHPDPGQTTAVVGVFTGTVTSGNTIVAGSIPGTMIDGGAPQGRSVLISPSGNQTITSGELIIAGGSLGLGTASVNSGVLALFNSAGSGLMEMFSGLTGVSATHNVSITTGTSLGQNTVYTLPDPGAISCLFNVTATSVTAGNILVAGSTQGVLEDSGVAIAQLELVSNIKAQVSGNIGGAGPGPLSVTVAGVTLSSVVVATVKSSSNPVSVISTAAAAGSFTVTLSADPGASCLINYIVFITPQ